MPLPISNTPPYKILTATSAASITSGFTTSVASPGRGKITNIYLCPIDGSSIGGANALLSLNIAGTASAQVSLPPAAAGRASTGEMLVTTANVAEGNIITATLAAGLTNAAVGVLVIVLRLM